MKGPLSYAAAVLGVELAGTDRPFEGVSTDTRRLEPGNLFVALPGERYDAHEHLDEARRRGAAGAVVSRRVDCDLPRIPVADTRAALASLAAEWRRRCPVPMIAVTGSNGKTTVKEMLTAICRRAGPTHATHGNFNNEIGVPLTLFGLTREHRYAVVELGANHPGEIRYLTRLAQPQVGVVTNAAAAHLEGFGSLTGVAEAKGELYEHMAPDAVAVINADDPYAMLWESLAAPRRTRCFGFRAGLDVSAESRDGRWLLQLPDTRFELTLQLPGRHNVANALAAAAAANALGIDAGAIEEGLAQVRPVKGRLMALHPPAGFTLLDDSYNANPASLAAGVQCLTEEPGEPWVVLGPMAELGDDAEAFHRQVGADLLEAGVKRLFTVGGATALTGTRFGAGARHFDDLPALIEALRAEVHPGVACLVKGSRSAGMDRVVDALMDHGNPALKRAGEGG